MNNPERRGFLIVVGVFLYVVVALLYFQITWITSMANAPDLHGWEIIGRILRTMPLLLVALFIWSRAAWRGQEFARWTGFAALAFFGVVLLCLSVWLTTLTYPEATAEARAEMMADDRQQLPARIGLAILTILIGAMLLLPSVGRFLQHRRTMWVALGTSPGHASG